MLLNIIHLMMTKILLYCRSDGMFSMYHLIENVKEDASSLKV